MFSVKPSTIRIKGVNMECSNGVDVAPPLQKRFNYLVVGKPGSGKSTLIINMLREKCMYNRQFDKVLWVTNSRGTLPDIGLPDENYIEGVNEEMLQSIIDEYYDGQRTEPFNMLLILDDVIGNIKKMETSPLLAKFFFNSRHILGAKSSVSLIVTTQKYNLLPARFRPSLTGIFLFESSNIEYDLIYNDHIKIAKKTWGELIEFVYTQPRDFMYLNLTNGVRSMFYRNFDQIVL